MKKFLVFFVSVSLYAQIYGGGTSAGGSSSGGATLPVGPCIVKSDASRNASCATGSADGTGDYQLPIPIHTYDAYGVSAALAASLGTAATKNVGTTAGTVAAGDDSRFSGSAPTTIDGVPTLEFNTSINPRLVSLTSALRYAGVQRVNLVVMGDSISGVTNVSINPSFPVTKGALWVDHLRRYLQGYYGNGGTGWIPIVIGANGSSSPNPIINDNYWTLTGTYTTSNITGPQEDSSQAPATYGNSILKMSPGAVASLNHVWGDKFEIWCARNTDSSGFAATIDGVSAGNVCNTSGAVLPRLVTLSTTLGDHTLGLTALGGGFGYLYAAGTTIGNQGVVVYNASVGGVTSAWFGADVSKGMAFSDLIPGGISGTIVALGTNEPGNGVSVGTYTTEMTNIVTHQLGVNSAVLVLVEPPSTVAIESALPAFAAAALGVAKANTTAFVSIRDRWQSGTLATQNALLGPDGLHPNEKGQLDIFYTVQGILTPPHSPLWGTFPVLLSDLGTKQSFLAIQNTSGAGGGAAGIGLFTDKTALSFASYGTGNAPFTYETLLNDTSSGSLNIRMMINHTTNELGIGGNMNDGTYASAALKFVANGDTYSKNLITSGLLTITPSAGFIASDAHGNASFGGGAIIHQMTPSDNSAVWGLVATGAGSASFFGVTNRTNSMSPAYPFKILPAAPDSGFQIDDNGLHIAINPAVVGHPTLELVNTNTADSTQIYLTGGRTYQIGSGGTGTFLGLSNKFFLYDSTGAVLRMTLDASGNWFWAGNFQVSGLGGSGTRMVVADSGGNLSTQAIPSGSGTTDTSGTIHSMNPTYGCVGNGTTDDTTCVQAALDATCPVNGTGIRKGGRMFLDAGKYLVTSKLRLENCDHPVISGGGAASHILCGATGGTSSSPSPACLEIHAQEADIGNFDIAPSAGFYAYVIALTNKGYVYTNAGITSYIDPGHNYIHNIKIDPSGGGYWSGMGMPCTKGDGTYGIAPGSNGTGCLDSNNDITTWAFMRVLHHAGACATVGASQNHNINFDQVYCAPFTSGLTSTAWPLGSATSVAGVYDGNVGLFGNIHWKGGYSNVASKVNGATYSGHANFYFGGPQVLPSTIEDVSIEGSCMVLDTAGPASNAGNIFIKGLRFQGDGYSTNTSNCANYPDIYHIRWAGTFTDENSNYFGSYTSGNTYGMAMKYNFDDADYIEHQNFTIKNVVMHAAGTTLADIFDNHAPSFVEGLVLTSNDTPFGSTTNVLWKNNNSSTCTIAANGTQVVPLGNCYNFSGTVGSGDTVYGFQDQYYKNIAPGYSYLVIDGGCTAGTNHLTIAPAAGSSGTINGSTSGVQIATNCGSMTVTKLQDQSGHPAWSAK